MGRRKKDTGETYEQRQERFERNLASIEKDIHRREVTFDTNNYVVMAYYMILHSASNLTWNEFKLLRFFIMQTEKDDKELFQYTVNIPKLAETIEISPKVLYREISDMTEHLMKEVIEIGSRKDDHWVMFHWVDVCEYDNGTLTVKLSDELKPFLVGLRGNFSRYRLSDLISFNSIYAGLLYEKINGYLNENNMPHADVAIEISISIEELRRITGTENKFERYSNFKLRVIDTALKEINQKSPYHITATEYKDGRAIAGFDFLIESQAGHTHRTKNQPKEINIRNESDKLDGQMNLMDYQAADNKFYVTPAAAGQQDKNVNDLDEQ